MKQYQKINIDGDHAPETLLNNLQHLKDLDKRYRDAEPELDAKFPELKNGLENGLNGIRNLNQMNDPNMTFKALRKKMGINVKDLRANNEKTDKESLSESEKSYHTIRSGIKQVGRVNIQDLLSELRRKYLTILKSHYWEFLEDGQCTPASYLLLNESADSCLDYESQEMQDWEYCKQYLFSNTTMQRIGRIAQIPCLGRFFKNMFFNELSLAYDVSINFMTAHEAADKLLQTVIESKSFVGQILLESQQQVHKTDAYLHANIEDMYPEIAKSIQLRRAEYFMLVH